MSNMVRGESKAHPVCVRKGIDDMLRRAGKNVVYGALSLTLAATCTSLIASVPTAWADDEANGTGEGQGGIGEGTADIASICMVGDDGASSEVESGGSYTTSDCVLTLSEAVAIDTDKTCARLWDRDNRFVEETGIAVREDVLEPDYMDARSEITFILGDGDYGRIEFAVWDVGGRCIEATVTDISIDTQAPIVRIGYPWHKMSGTGDGLAYFDEQLVLPISIADRHVDVDRTTVCDRALRGLVEDGCHSNNSKDAFSCAAWAESANEDGLTVLSSMLMLGDGAYDLPLARAFDQNGQQAGEPVQAGSERMCGIVVDTQPPVVEALVDGAPAMVLGGEGQSPTVVFDGRVVLRICPTDASGIASVSLDEKSRRSGMGLASMPDGDGYLLESKSGVIDDTMSVTIRDLAGNERVWSLAPKGTQRRLGKTEEVDNEPIRLPAGDQLCPSGYPARLVEDTDAPRVTLTGVDEGELLRSPRKLGICVEDNRWGHVATGDGERIVATLRKDDIVVAQCGAAYDDARFDDTSHEYVLEVPACQDHTDDGHYVLTVMATDLAGHKSERLCRSFVVDTTSPTLDVTYADGDGFLHGPKSLVARRHVVRMSVHENEITTDALDAADAPLHIAVRAEDGGEAHDVVVGEWQQGADPGTFFCELVLGEDGTFSVGLSGHDLAGNPLTGSDGTHVGEGGYNTPWLVVDTTAPTIAWEIEPQADAPRRHAGIDYYRHPVTVALSVVDRNLDERRCEVTGPDGQPITVAWERSRRGADGNITHTARVTYMEDACDDEIGCVSLVVDVADHASNRGFEGPYRFVVDQTAPTITSASMSRPPTRTLLLTGMEDPVLFFNEQDGGPASITLSFMDEHLLDAAWADDPSGAYAVQVDDLRGKRAGELLLALEDPERYGEGEAGVLDRDVRVVVQDLAGNARIWTIDHNGELVADRDTGTQNVSLGGQGLYPLALIDDALAPRIRMEGVAEGRYYNSAQQVLISIDERNFAFLQQFDPQRPIVLCARREGGGEKDKTTWRVSAGQFVGSGAHYSYVQQLSLDGRYELVAQFDDVANNPSDTVRLGSFTLDSTPPQATVAWDNNDVRNGMYYRAPRTATITVVERNFDASLVEINTSGRVGEWSTRGDAHVCEVRFDADASSEQPHTLSVEVTDRAGNSMEPVREEDFVIDTKAPTAVLKRRVSEQDPFLVGQDEVMMPNRTAFSQAMVPIVELADEESLDASQVVATLEVERDGALHTAAFTSHREAAADNRMRVWWDNLGLDLKEDGTYYRLDADGIYRLSAEAVDLAGNTSGLVKASFSINRYGSNYYVEHMEGGHAANGVWGEGALLTEPPRIVVHEINVSGMATVGPEHEEECMVTKEHAHATSKILRTEGRESQGYVLKKVGGGEGTGAEGWSEYVYDIAPGNFGKGSDSDQGDGGQGTYRVDISSTDLAGNSNTTARYWDTPAPGVDGLATQEPSADLPSAKEGTVSFTLDEDGPVVSDLMVPNDVVVGRSCRATFRLVDQVTDGDEVRVLLNGEPVELHQEGSDAPLNDGELLSQGTYWFCIPARTVFVEQDVLVEARDYTGLESRVHRVRSGGIRVTTLLWETSIVLMVLGLVCGMAALWNHLKRSAGKH